KTSEDQVALNVFDGLSDKYRLVTSDCNFDIRRENRPDLLIEPLHHVVNDAHRIGSRLLHNRKRHRILTIDTGKILDFLHSIAYTADIAKRYGLAVPLSENDFVKVFGIRQPSHRSHGILRSAGREVTAWNFDILAVNGIADLIDGEAIGRHAIRIHE